MDGELKKLIKVWTLVITCLCYCYYIASRIPKGKLRLLSILPIFYFFLMFPLELTSFHLGFVTAGLLVWLTTFKLLLFSFDQGPLIPLPQTPLHFISIACLPIRVNNQNSTKPSYKDNNSTTQNVKPNTNSSTHFLPRSILILSIKIVLLLIIFQSYNYRQYMHPYVVLALYCVHVYLELELVLAICATPARALFGFELEPQFNEPYFATSLQDFWGHRWNLMINNILRLTVYIPVKRISTRFFRPLLATVSGVTATFVVSGLMHEILYYYATRVSPTWEVTWFFVLHGICVSTEIVVKKMVGGRWQLAPVVARPLVVVFVGVTGVWLFLPQLLRNGVDDKIIEEYVVLVKFVGDKFSTVFS